MENNFWCAEFKATLILFGLGEEGTPGEQEHVMQRNTQHKDTSSQHRRSKQGVQLDLMAVRFCSFCFNNTENVCDICWDLELRLALSGETNTLENIFLISHRLQKQTLHHFLLVSLQIFGKQKSYPKNLMIFVNGFGLYSPFIFSGNSFAKPLHLWAGEETWTAGAQKGQRRSWINLSVVSKWEASTLAQKQFHLRY